MRHYWKLAFALLVLGVLIWGMRSSSDAQLLYPMKPPEARPEITPTAKPTVELTGIVRWMGGQPSSVSFRRPRSPHYPLPDSTIANPLVPQCKLGEGLPDVFVTLDGPEADHIPWPHAPVSLSWQQYDCEFKQGTVKTRFGLVRLGDEIELLSSEPVNHSTRARGADFFTLMHVKPNQPLKKAMHWPGIVELSSGSWYYWGQARLLVHPNGGCTKTDAVGKFTLQQVPEGTYTLTVYKPHWLVTRFENDPEFPVPVRAIFAPTIKKSLTIDVTQRSAPLEIQLSDD